MESESNFKLMIAAVMQYEVGQISKETLDNRIIAYISENESVIPNLINILAQERKVNKQLVSDCNSELSMALVLFDSDQRTQEVLARQVLIVEKIKKFYLKWKHRIVCNFKVDGLPQTIEKN